LGQDDIKAIFEYNDVQKSYTVKKPEAIVDSALSEKASKVIANGIGVYYAEGEGNLCEAPDFLLNTFSGYVSEGVKEYLKIRDSELKKYPVIEDGGLAVSWDEIGDRLVAWEKFTKEFGDYTEEVKKADKKIDYYLKLYVAGEPELDNTPKFVSGKLDDDLRRSYVRFIGTYTDSKYYNLISHYYDLLKNNDFENNEEAESYLKNNLE
jgi:hypothetical protein